MSVVVRPVEESPGLEAWRIVPTDDTEDPAFLDAFRSSYERGKPPRKVERTAAVIHMGLSMHWIEGPARATATRWPMLGDFLARMILRPGRGFCVAQTGAYGHLTIWGDPVKLSEDAVEIYPA